MEDISKIDPNFKPTGTDGRKMRIYDIEDSPFKIYGIFKEDYRFIRIPYDVASAVSQPVYNLNTNTSGGRVRFKTNSRYIALKCTLPNIVAMPHMPFSGICGFDLYADGKFKNTFLPGWDYLSELYKGTAPYMGYESVIDLGNTDMQDIIINFPLYNGVNKVYIGIDENALLEEGDSYQDISPIVFYGSSITQGGCVSRPGNSFASIISRKFNRDFINLGFSGNARAEDAIAEYIASLDMSIFIYDYDHNAPSIDHLQKTHYKMYKKVRDAHPDIPIIMASRPCMCGSEWEVSKRISIIEETLNRAKSKGDKNIYFVNGITDMMNMLDPDIMTIDNCHPGDFGSYCMAMAFEKVLKEIIS